MVRCRKRSRSRSLDKSALGFIVQSSQQVPGFLKDSDLFGTKWNSE